MTRENGKRLSAGKRLAGLLLLFLVMIVSFTIPFMIGRSISSPKPVIEPPETSDSAGIVGYIGLMFAATLLSFALGMAAYALTLGTHCFTFNFHKPFWDSVKKKLYIMQIVVTVLLGIGAAFLVSMGITPILMAFGLPLSIASVVPMIGTFFLIQLLTVWIDIWQPLGKSTLKKRLSVLGVPGEEVEKGICIGISDPSKSSFKKMTMVEEDVGVLWLYENKLVYKGDNDSFDISREQFIEVERVADAGSTSAYFGNVNVIIRFWTADGPERRVRLHPETAWTLSGRAKESDRLADLITRWKEGRFS